MAEFGDIVVYMVNREEKVQVKTLAELLPNSFEQDDLMSGQENGQSKEAQEVNCCEQLEQK